MQCLTASLSFIIPSCPTVMEASCCSLILSFLFPLITFDVRENTRCPQHGADLTFLITQQLLQKATGKTLMGAINPADGEHISTPQVRSIHAEAVRKQVIAGMKRAKSSRTKEKA